MRADCRLLIMTKAPVTGRVKTRLIPACSAQQAADWQRAMCDSVIAQARRLFDDVWLAVDEPEHPYFARRSIPTLAQGGGDLGQRLRHVVRALQSTWRPLLIVGSDSPHMHDARLLQGVDALRRHEVVIGPVEDGGYNLLGMRNPHLALFRHIDWGGSRVLSQTMTTIRRLRLSCKLLDMDYDIDTIDELRRALQEGWRPPNRPSARIG